MDIKYIRQPHKGPAAARNTGIKNAVGDIIIFNDDDKLAHPDFITEHVKEVRNSPKTVVIGWKKRILSIWREDLQIDNRDLLAILHRRPALIKELSSKTPLALFSLDQIKEGFDEVLLTFSLGDDWNWEEVITRYSERLEGFLLPWIIPTGANMSVFREFIV